MTTIPDPEPRECFSCGETVTYREEREHELLHLSTDERLRGAPGPANTISFYFRWVKYVPEDRRDEFRYEVGELATAYYQRGEIAFELSQLISVEEEPPR